MTQLDRGCAIVGVVGLHVEPQQRLGVRRSDIEPPVARPSTVSPSRRSSATSSPAGERRRDRVERRPPGRVTREVDLAGRGVRLVVGGERGRPARRSRRGPRAGAGPRACRSRRTRSRGSSSAPSARRRRPRRCSAIVGLDQRVADPGPHRDAPCARDVSGTARLVIRLWIDARARLPGELADRDQRGQRRRRDHLPRSSTDEAPVGVAVEGEPDVGARSRTTVACRSTRFAGVAAGSASWFGNVPSSSKYSGTSSRSSVPKTAGTVSPAIAVAGVDDDAAAAARRPARARCRYSAYGASRSRSSSDPRDPAGGPGRLAGRAVRATDRVQAGVRPTARRRPARHSLTPLYAAGLCDAVNIAAGQPEPAGREVQHVGGRPARSSPRRCRGPGRPSAKAAASPGELGRMS